MDTGLKQDLIHPEIAKARENALIHEQRFDGPAASRESLFELCHSELCIQWIEAETLLCDECLGIVDEPNTAEEAHVFECEQTAAGKPDHDAREARDIPSAVEIAAHPEVEIEPRAAANAREEVLAMPAGSGEPLPFEHAPEVGEAGPIQNASIRHLDVLDALP